MRPLSGEKMETSRAARHQVIWINGRFLSRKVTGVERVAHEILRALHAWRSDSWWSLTMLLTASRLSCGASA